MLQIITDSRQLEFGSIMQVYHQSLLKTGAEHYPQLDESRQLLEAEQDFYVFLKTFLRQENSFCAFWVEDGRYVSALRAEPYRNGFLIEGFETDPQYRRRGYAVCLLRAVLQHMQGSGSQTLYSHIHKRNLPSIQTHLACGFVCDLDYAAYVDGSVDHQSYTYIKNIP